MMGLMRKWVLLCIACMSAVVPMYAHHSFAAEFDEKKIVDLVGTVLEMEWVNPHTWIHIAVPNPDGTISKWMIEGNTPNSLLRAGFTKNSLAPGTEVIIHGYQARSGELKASGSTITFRDGRQMNVGERRDTNPLLDWVSSDEAVWRKVAAAEKSHTQN